MAKQADCEVTPNEYQTLGGYSVRFGHKFALPQYAAAMAVMDTIPATFS